MSDEQNPSQNSPAPVATVQTGVPIDNKVPVPMFSAEQIQALALSAQRSQALEAEVAELKKMLLAQAARSGAPTGKVVRVHCNLCGADANSDGTPSCGHSDFINHLTHGNRMLPDGNIEMVLARQTRVV